MVFPKDHVPVCAVMDVLLRPAVGCVCAGCLSLSDLALGGGWGEVPFATGGVCVGALKS